MQIAYLGVLRNEKYVRYTIQSLALKGGPPEHSAHLVHSRGTYHAKLARQRHEQAATIWRVQNPLLGLCAHSLKGHWGQKTSWSRQTIVLINQYTILACNIINASYKILKMKIMQPQFTLMKGRNSERSITTIHWLESTRAPQDFVAWKILQL